ncbi:MAG: hypothetical protein KA981_06620 [Bacteroidia bacterium]|jgi:hypothetical protein|nr:hypothetical protein [Bacteroidia bacterium]
MFKNENVQHWLYRLKIIFYMVVILFFFLVFVLELKRVYKIDIVPGVNGPIDDIYFKLKDAL